MSKVLIITGTVNPKSRSLALLERFLEEYKVLNPKDTFETIDLNNEPMANMALTTGTFSEFFGQEMSNKYVEQLKNVDKLIVVAPMHNYKITAMLSNYIDHICVPQSTFTYGQLKPNGQATGMLTNLKVQVLATRGTELKVEPSIDHASYLNTVFNFLGAKVNSSILMDGLDLPENVVLEPKELVSRYAAQISRTVKEF